MHVAHDNCRRQHADLHVADEMFRRQPARMHGATFLVSNLNLHTCNMHILVLTYIVCMLVLSMLQISMLHYMNTCVICCVVACVGSKQLAHFHLFLFVKLSI